MKYKEYQEKSFIDLKTRVKSTAGMFHFLLYIYLNYLFSLKLVIYLVILT
jgi:hypothetical protein